MPVRGSFSLVLLCSVLSLSQIACCCCRKNRCDNQCGYAPCQGAPMYQPTPAYQTYPGETYPGGMYPGETYPGTPGPVMPAPEYTQPQPIPAAQTPTPANDEELASLKKNLTIANERITNLNNERNDLHQKYLELLKGGPTPQVSLSPEATKRFEELSRKYPDLEFDPATGVAKFHTDILFDLGKADVKPPAMPVLKEFVNILNQSDAKDLHILVVGHTDDHAIVKQQTLQSHPTNWHLSTDRADAVITLLAKMGLAEERMGAAGYSMYQPISKNADDQTRSLNRRVEIYILAPDAVIAGWEPPAQRRQ